VKGSVQAWLSLPEQEAEDKLLLSWSPDSAAHGSHGAYQLIGFCFSTYFCFFGPLGIAFEGSYYDLSHDFPSHFSEDCVDCHQPLLGHSAAVDSHSGGPKSSGHEWDSVLLHRLCHRLCHRLHWKAPGRYLLETHR